MLTQDQQQKLIGALLKKPQNALCADCNSKSPCWASLDFGVFVCMNCSGAHRSLGQSVTRIKSTKLDAWNRDWLWHMQLNNRIINQYFEASLNPVLHKKPTPSSSLNDIKKFVYDKYVRRLFSASEQDDPITNLKNGKPPLKNYATQSETGKKETPNVQKEKSSPNKPINNTQSITVKPIKHQKNLLDDASDESNRAPSITNEKIRQQVNLFQEPENQSQKSTSSLGHMHLYNKQHYNSFSGKGATHSSTGAINFDNIFSITPHQVDKNVSFDEFNRLANQGGLYSTPAAHHQYGHVHQHHLPHMHIYSTGVGTGMAHHQPHHHIINQPPTHVTMNINMNMYSNVMNINLQDNPTPAATTKPKDNIPDAIRLDVNDFTVKKKEVPEMDKKKSWVDDWK